VSSKEAYLLTKELLGPVFQEWSKRIGLFLFERGCCNSWMWQPCPKTLSFLCNFSVY
jgi:hypothetical protein